MRDGRHLLDVVAMLSLLASPLADSTIAPYRRLPSLASPPASKPCGSI